MVKKTKSKRLRLVKMGTTTTSRYFDSLSVVEYEIVKVNDDGLLKLVGRFERYRTFRYFFRDEDKIEHHKKVIEKKRDILAEISAMLNEGALWN